MKNRIHTMLLLLLCTTTVIGKQVEVNIQHLTQTEGLASNSIRQIYQDSKGFIWFSTINNGMCRYDGSAFISIYPTYKNEPSLADPRIRLIEEDRNNFLWISTVSNHFSCYDLKRNRFVDFTGSNEYQDHYMHISFIGEDTWMWGKDKGCRKVSYKEGVFASVSFCVDNNELPSDVISFLSKGANGRIWIGTNNGLCSYEDGKIIWWNDELSFQWTRSILGKDYFITADGRIWMADSNAILSEMGTLPQVSSSTELPGELVLHNKWFIFTKQQTYVFDPQQQSLHPASKELNVPNAFVQANNRGDYLVYNKTGKVHYVNASNGDIKTFELMPVNSTIFWGERYSSYHDSRGILWITTYGNGLFAYHTDTNQLQHFSKETSGIASNILLNVMEDKSGSIWVGSEFAGAFHLRVIDEGSTYIHSNENKDEFSNIVRMVSTTDNGDVWFSTRNGKVYVYDETLTIHKATDDYRSNIYAIAEDNDGTKWIGTRGSGVYIGKNQYVNISTDFNSLGVNNVFCIQKDHAGRMWVGTFGQGLHLAIKDAISKYRFQRFFNESYEQARIRSLCVDKKGRMWVGTNDGVFVFNPNEMIADETSYQSYNVQNKALRSNEISSIFEDSKGNIWIAEVGVGFCICTPKTNGKFELKHYTTEDGLVNGMVQAFAEDKQGRMWITTKYGISCFDPETDRFYNFFFSSNMQGNVCSDNCAISLPDGRIVIGTNLGLAIINPDVLSFSKQNAIVTFTDLIIDGASVVPQDKDAPINRSMAYEDVVRLKHNQNSFKLNFSTMDYSYFTGAQYSYILKNYENNWSIPSDNNYATYKNLVPGTYYLHVKACNSMGVWNNEEAVLKIIITPPFWRTTLAYILFAMCTIIVFYTLYRMVKNIYELRNNVKTEKLMTEYKLRFFTNISHEFRTPLTLILGALERLQHSTSDPVQTQNAIKVMEKGSQRMMRLVNQLLEFRKMRNNKLQLALEELDIVDYLREIFCNFEDEAAAKQMKFQFNADIPSYNMFVDKNNIDKVVYNLLSNALKYTPMYGKINFNISIDSTSRTFTISVTDSGIGVSKDKRQHLFSRFMHNHASSDSMGVGLNLTQELVIAHKGTIQYEENAGGGSVFTVILPTDVSVYENSDFITPLNESSINETQAIEPTIELTKPATTTPQKPLNHQHILVIEDNLDIREIIRAGLEPYFEVIVEPDGISGLERACTGEQIDLIICDVMMPGLSGYEVTKRLKQDFNTSHIPIILLTALNTAESHLEGIESGADAYITKPFNSKLVLARILKLLEQREKLREKFSNDLSFKSSILCTTEKDKEFIERLTDTIEKQLNNAEFSIDDFASKMNMGRTTFFNKVRSLTGYSPKEYLRVLRMRKAAELLLASNYTSAEVAFNVGFNDPSYFNKCFKEQFGVTPKGYVRTIKDTNKEG